MATATPSLDEDWEEWTPEKGSFINHMMAGSAAGVAEHVSIFPIDTIKVSIERHMQSSRRVSMIDWRRLCRPTCSASGAQ